ncbi:MAG: hypothetical protein WBX19_08855 [Terracidiphilus sp.]
MNYDPIASLEAIGYAGREASFLYLVAMHSGYFLRRQFFRFAGREGGALIERLLTKALRLRHLRVIECGQDRHIYQLTSKPVYEALGRGDSQNRRIKSDAHIKSRLMVLDFVLAHLRTKLLEDEDAKKDFFATQCGIQSELLPKRQGGRLLYFPDNFPILVSHKGIPGFTFFDEGQATVARFERFLDQHQPLFEALSEFELLFVSDSESNSARAKDAFNRFLPADRVLGVTPMTPFGVDHFLQYLTVKQRVDDTGSGILAGNLKVLDEGESIYTSLEHQALYSAWRMGSTSADKIRLRFLESSLCAAFSTVVLPYRYPVYTLRHDTPFDDGYKTPQQTPDQTHRTEV